MTKPAFKPKKILWVDLEMTGLNPREDIILEVAAIVTDWELREIATFEGIIKHDELIIREKMARSAVFWNENSEAREGLLKQNNAGRSSDIVERDILAFINEYCVAEPNVLLAGNSIHQDRKFIEHYWKQLDARLHYRMLDVSAWKVVFEGKYSKKFAKPEKHRALDDIRGSIEELQYYLKKVSC